MKLKLSAPRKTRHSETVCGVGWIGAESVLSAADDHNFLLTNTATNDAQIILTMQEWVFFLKFHVKQWDFPAHFIQQVSICSPAHNQKALKTTFLPSRLLTERWVFYLEVEKLRKLLMPTMELHCVLVGTLTEPDYWHVSFKSRVMKSVICRWRGWFCQNVVKKRNVTVRASAICYSCLLCCLGFCFLKCSVLQWGSVLYQVVENASSTTQMESSRRNNLMLRLESYCCSHSNRRRGLQV